METLFLVLILIFSVIIHEVAHGYVAGYLGDPTAKYAGRLTLNPIVHIDLLGSFIIPVFLILTQAGFVFGWAKPVPVNPYNLRNQRWGTVLVSAAGPLSNLLLAFIFGVLIQFSGDLGFTRAAVDIMSGVVLINIILALFNLIPMPPLDGSKILFGVFGAKGVEWLRIVEEQWILTMFIALFVIFPLIIEPLIKILYLIFTGVAFG